MGTMASSTHQFGVLDLIRAGLQDLDTARTLLDELRADGIDDDRLCLLMKTLEQTCEPDIALRNFVDIIKALQSQGRDFHQVITDDAGLVRLVTVLGVSDEMGKLMRFRPELVMPATHAKAICTTTRNAARMSSKRSVPTRPTIACQKPRNHSPKRRPRYDRPTENSSPPSWRRTPWAV